MAKIMKQFRLQKEIVDILEKLSYETGKTQTQIIEEAIKNFFEDENKQKSAIEIFKRENEQLKMVIKVLQEREKAIEEVKNVYERLINEKDERIKELQDALKEKSRPFWKFW